MLASRKLASLQMFTHVHCPIDKQYVMYVMQTASISSDHNTHGDSSNGNNIVDVLVTPCASFFAQQGHLGVLNYVVDCLNFMSIWHYCHDDKK